MTDSQEKYLKRLQRERTARLEAERLLEEKSEELYLSLLETQSSQLMLQSALASMADGFLLLNKHDEVVLANDQLKNIYFERSHIFIAGRSIASGFIELTSHPDYLSVKSGERADSYFEIEYPDKVIVSVSIGTTAEGHLASTHRDITELKKDEEEKRNLLIDLMRSQRMEAIGRMSGMIAHDFNNIIAAIQGFAGFLQEDLPDDPALHEMVHRIISSTSRAQDLIKQILEYGNQQQASMHQVSLTPVIDDCIDMLAPTLNTTVDMSVVAPDTPIWIEGNESRLGQLFTNLFTNSARAIGEKPGEIKIVVEQREGFDLQNYHKRSDQKMDMQGTAVTVLGNLRYESSCVLVTVSDNGCGMNQEQIDRIFEMYFTTRPDAAHGGVGMSSVAEVVTEYQGGIQIFSKPGLGTTVAIVFPLLKKMTSQLQKTQKELLDFSQQKFDVLLIDDDTNVGEMAKQMLQRSGICVEYISSSPSALQLILENPNRWKVIISDQIMPEMKGTDLYREIRQRSIQLPFLICSGKIDADSQIDIDSANIRVIPKPIDKDLMLRQIESYL